MWPPKFKLELIKCENPKVSVPPLENGNRTSEIESSPSLVPRANKNLAPLYFACCILICLIPKSLSGLFLFLVRIPFKPNHNQGTPPIVVKMRRIIFRVRWALWWLSRALGPLNPLPRFNPKTPSLKTKLRAAFTGLWF